MISFWGIVKLTCRAAIRSHIFHMLLFILILTIAILPNTILGDGTASGYIQVSLKYCLGAISFILSLSTIWVSCFILSSDLESYQIHMVFAKPVSRVKVWLGKWMGIVILHGVLLLLSSSIVYGLILWQFYRKPFSNEEKVKIENEVLVGRKVFMPEIPDIDSIVREQYQKRLEYLKNTEAENYKVLTSAEKKKMIKDIRKEIIARMGEVKPGSANVRQWTFKGLSKDTKTPLYFRYRTYVGKISSKDQRETAGVWSIRIMIPENEDQDIKNVKAEKIKMREVFVAKTEGPELIMCGVFHEIALLPAAIDENGMVNVAFGNLDPQRMPVFFQFADGPKLLIKVSPFRENYMRAVFMILIKLFFLAGLGCAAGGLFSMPVAVFVVISYLLLGIFSSFIIDIENQFSDDVDQLAGMEEWHETIGRNVSHVLLWGIIPLQKLEVSDTVANGESIEYSFILRTMFEFFLIRGLPIFLIGIWFYRQRELGTIIRK